MTRTGRFVAGVGAVVLGVVAVVLVQVVMSAVGLDQWWLVGVASLVAFGLTVAALYTWAVDGPFVRSHR